MDQDQEGISLENHVFCGIIETRLATLLEQIVAFEIVSKSGYKIAKVGSELNKFGYKFTKKQESIYSLLQQLTNPIRGGNLKTALVEVASNARDENQQIRELFSTKFFQLYEEIDKALAGDDDDLKEECMEALIIGLVDLIVSLFGVRFQQLIPHASQYIDETLEAHLNGASQNLNRFKMTMDKADKERLKEDYIEIVSRFSFEHYFPCQKWKREEFEGINASPEALLDIFSYQGQLLDVHVERGKPEETELRKVLEKEREIARLEADKQMDLAILCREMSDLTHDLTSTKSTNLDLKNKLNQEISYKNREREDILKFIVVMKNERKSIQHQEKELEAKLAKSEMIAKNLKEERDFFQREFVNLLVDVMDKKEIVKGHIAVIMPMIDKLIEQFKYLPAEQLIQKIKEAIEEIGKTVEGLGRTVGLQAPIDN